MLATGSLAPDFRLKTKRGEELVDIGLGDHRGRNQVVLLFFPLAFTSTCTEEMCGISNGMSAYATLQASVYGISVDSPYAQAVWAKEHGIDVTLLSDLNKAVTKAYDVLLPMIGGIGDASARAAFVIGKDGVIKYAEQTPTLKDLPDFNAVKASLRS